MLPLLRLLVLIIWNSSFNRQAYATFGNKWHKSFSLLHFADDSLRKTVVSVDSSFSSIFVLIYHTSHQCSNVFYLFCHRHASWLSFFVFLSATVNILLYLLWYIQPKQVVWLKRILLQSAIFIYTQNTPKRKYYCKWNAMVETGCYELRFQFHIDNENLR